jgi:ferredoxin
MIAQYGFKDGSGDWFVVIDTDKCTGCGDCVRACPANVLEVGEDEYDPCNEEPVASVKAEERNKIRYSCAPCQPGYGENPPPCEAACEPGAISHSEGWRLLYGAE